LIDKTSKNRLDIQILYLRRVHGFCYYCLREYENERMLSYGCANTHLRSHVKLGPRKLDSVQSYANESEWDANFTRLAKQKIASITDRVNNSVIY
jgi:hypothetical protein